MRLDGKSLERATELIEKHILNHIEESKVGQIRIETNKIIICDGVRHEIDVFVTVDLKIGTPLFYIFECKNYKNKPVSKNDIIVFIEKIGITKAQKGYFIARNYTKDAENQARKSQRLELLPLTSGTEIDSINFLGIKSKYVKNANLDFHVAPFTPISKEITYCKVIIRNNEPITIQNLISDKITHPHEDDSDVETLVKRNDYWEFLIKYSDIIFEDKEVSELVLKVRVEYAEIDSELVFDYEIQGKGRYTKLKLKDITGEKDLFIEITKVGNDYRIDNINGM